METTNEQRDELAELRAVRATKKTLPAGQMPGLPHPGITEGENPDRRVPGDLYRIAGELNLRIAELESQLLAKNMLIERLIGDQGDWRKTAMNLLRLTPSHTKGWRNFGEILSTAVSMYDKMGAGK